MLFQHTSRILAVMPRPVTMDIPHRLGAAEARRRLAESTHELADFIPGGAAQVNAAWSGDRLRLDIAALGETVTANLDVHDRFVRMELLLPGLLGVFGARIAGALGKGAAGLLEDRSPKAKR